MTQDKITNDESDDRWRLIKRNPTSDAELAWNRLFEGKYECPSCGSPDGLFQRVSCQDCGWIPEEDRW